MPKSALETHRIQIYFDCICGGSTALLSISCIILVAVSEGIKEPFWFTFGLTFWICFLVGSLGLIGLGFYTYYQEKNYKEREPRKDLKPPIVS